MRKRRENGDVIRVPADWEPPRAIWIAWPHNRDTWPGNFDPIPDCFRRIIGLIAEVAPVHVIGDVKLRVGARIDHIPNVTWFDIRTDDCWIRDYGPTFVVENDEKRYAIDWSYNAWGGKYPPWDADDAATAKMIRESHWNHVKGGLCLEGGALEWDGTGRLLTSTTCLVTDTRNPGWSKDQIVERLREIAGAREVFWVDGGGLAGDDTDGHIDQLARFVDRETIVVASCDPTDTANHTGLESNYRLLSQWANETSPGIAVHRLPIPPVRFVQGRRVPESYCNFLRVGSNRILVPTFRSERTDSHAIDLLTTLAQQQSPNIRVIGVDCYDLVWGLGALHCASCNEPLVKSPSRRSLPFRQTG